jgi:hypothetical protein
MRTEGRLVVFYRCEDPDRLLLPSSTFGLYARQRVKMDPQDLVDAINFFLERELRLAARP